jgi:hypothetical protein|tara:strand:+ start:3952 stop:4890 length:939 start_codon:yes stop_codon:yes gene_type:complete
MNNTLEEELQVEIVDDTPEQDKPFVKEPDQPEVRDQDAESSEDNDLEGYSEKVQKRIKKMKYDYHEERRAKESAVRMREEAVKFAENANHENARLKKLIEIGGKALTSASEARVDNDLGSAERLYKEAYENGDSDSMLQAQKQIATLTYEKNKLTEPTGSWSDYPQEPAPQQQAAQALPEADPKAVDWLKNNDWFQKPGNEEMTSFAYGLHEKLVRTENVNPSSDEYYSRINSRMREVFPTFFDIKQETVTVTDEYISPQSRPRTANVVAPSQRSTGKAPRKIKLTGSAVKLAKRLGLTNEQYATQVLKESN